MAANGTISSCLIHNRMYSLNWPQILHGGQKGPKKSKNEKGYFQKDLLFSILASIEVLRESVAVLAGELDAEPAD